MSEDASELTQYFNSMGKAELVDWLRTHYGSDEAELAEELPVKELRHQLVQNNLC